MAKTLAAKPAPPAPGSRALGKVVPGDGPMPCALMFVGEMPGYDEVRSFPPRPFVGNAGAELMRYLTGERLPYRKDCYLTNVVKQQPAGKVVSKAELDYWLPELWDEVEVCDPDVIVPLGAAATRVFLGPGLTMERVHGLAFRVGRRIICPCYNPAATLHSPELQSYFAADMEALALGLKTGRPELDARPGFHVYGSRAMGLTHSFRFWQPDRTPTAYRYLPVDIRIPRAFSIDTEGWDDDPWGLTISWAPGEAYIVRAFDYPQLATVQEALNRATRVTCQGLLHDLDVLTAMGLRVPEAAFDDTQIMSYLLSLEPQSLKDLAYRHLGAQQDEYTDIVAEADASMVIGYLDVLAASYDNAKVVKAVTQVLAKIAAPGETRAPRKIWNGSKFSKAVPPPPKTTLDNVDQAKATHYACRDADLTERLRPILYAKVKERGLLEVYARDMAVLPIVHRMQHVGMRIDRGHFQELLETFFQARLDVLEVIRDCIGHELNPDSGPQVAKLLFDDLGLEGQRLVKSRTRFSTEDKFLEALRLQHPVVPLIIEARELTKLRSSYAAAILEASQGSEYIFPHLRITRVVSGRVSAFDPNVLAIPKHSPLGKLIRMGFIAGDGHLLLSHDLSQIELRVAAHDSKEPGMIAAFRAGQDIHAALGERLFGVKAADQDDSRHRLPCKKVNFGIWMGISARGISEQLAAAGIAMDEGDCQKLIDETFRIWPRIPEYQSEKEAEARRYGYVTDFCGRRRYLAGVRSPNKWVQLEAARQAYATPIQSGAQEVFKTWMSNVWTTVIQDERTRRHPRYLEPWLQVHDDLIVEVHASRQQSASRGIFACIPQMLSVPVTAKAEVAERWGDLQEAT